ncbi:MAG: TetR family transcriptional regulator [Acidimicrobiia bacterium]|nr:TetR family transcriptional regulator [Acidimicrobiia bacterium]
MVTTERLPLSRARVVAEALALVDAHGTEALTMRRLGACLGVEAMSLYNHVESKDDLLDGIASLLLELVEVPEPPEQDWRRQLRAIASSVREVGLRHPRAFPLLVSRRHTTLASWAPILGGFTEARRAGLAAGPSVHVVHTFAGFLVGFVLLETRASGDASKAADHHPDDVPADQPRLREYVAACRVTTSDEQFDAGVALLIAGMEHLVETGAVDLPARHP